MALLRVVDRDGIEHEVEGRTGLKVMENLRELDYGVAAICGGMCYLSRVRRSGVAAAAAGDDVR
jgi:hypothetical protein